MSFTGFDIISDSLVGATAPSESQFTHGQATPFPPTQALDQQENNIPEAKGQEMTMYLYDNPTTVVVDLEQIGKDILEMKEQVNASFGEVAALIVDLFTKFEQLEERIRVYNARSSHKL